MQNPAEAFEREIEENEPVLELLAAKDANWHWLRYPYLARGRHRREAARGAGLSAGASDTVWRR